MPIILRKPILDVSLLLMILGVTTLIYWQGLNGRMIFDDLPNIVSNDWLHIEKLNIQSLRQAWYSGTSSELGRPLSMVSFALNYWADRLNPWGYKFVNLVIHLINGLLIIWFLRGVIKTPVLKENIANKSAASWLKLLPYAICAAWLLNPINTTSVLYIVQRMTELATLFTFIGMAGYVHLRLKINNCDLKEQRLWLGFAVALFIILLTTLAVLSKETGALLPLYLLIIEWIFFRFQFPSPADRKRFIAGYAVFCGIPALVVAYILLFHFSLIADGYLQRDFTLEQRLLTEPRIIGTYLAMMIAPVFSDFGLYHDDFPVSSGLFSPLDTALWIVSLALVFLAALLSTRKAPLISFGLLFFFVSHSIESTVISLELMHEHRNYPGSMGVMLSLFALLLNDQHWPDSKRIRQGLAIAFLALFAANTQARADTWGNLVQHAFSMQQNHPLSARSALGASQILAQIYRQDPHKFAAMLPTAESLLKRAQSSDPGNPNLESAIILLHWFAKKPVPDEQIDSLTDALKKQSHRASTASILGILIRCRKHDDCPIDHQKMTEFFQAALDNPRLLPAQRAHIASLISLYALEVMQNKTIAIQHQKFAILFAPEQARHKLNLIRNYIAIGDYDNAQNLLDTYANSPGGSRSPVINDHLQAVIKQRREHTPTETSLDHDQQ